MNQASTTPAIQKQEVIEQVKRKLRQNFGRFIENARPSQIYKSVALVLRDTLMDSWLDTRDQHLAEEGKRLYYLSVEFLMGRSLRANLTNLLAVDAYRDALLDLGIDLNDVAEQERDAGLGNGGLGRLAACFMDSLATLELPAMGCGIRYEYGLFRQAIVDGDQVELPDTWLEDGSMWEIPCYEDQVTVKFGGRIEEYWTGDRMYPRHVDYTSVCAVPYDVPVGGWRNKHTNLLRLWKANAPDSIDMQSFSRGEYVKASESQALAEVISKVLYPDDRAFEGRLLRLKQHYFFTSATVQYILSDFHKHFPDLPIAQLPEKCVIHINDTHPALAIPELMRLLLDEEGCDWDTAFAITQKIFAYTNHTVMSEALESWPVSMVSQLLPRIYAIIDALNEHYCQHLFERFPGDFARISRMAIIADGNIRMANLSIAASFCVNGVSQLHADLLKQTIFKDFYEDTPDKFIGITNGITHRRWLMSANPELSALLDQTIGTKWRDDASHLADLKPFAKDAAFQKVFADIKRQKKVQLCDFLGHSQGAIINPDSIFDVQAKRLHEYKRQLLNVLHIISLYHQIDQNPGHGFPPRTFLFAAKAASAYTMAKRIIRLVHAVAKACEQNPKTKDLLKVVFVQNYSVSIAERLLPAANLSEQISTAGMEASGTGNMKLMMNGALTIGTWDGANIEMCQEVGEENMYLFGAKADQTGSLWKHGGYVPAAYMARNPYLSQAMLSLIDGTLRDSADHTFGDIYQALLGGEAPDHYFVLKDFDSYAAAHHAAMEDYANPKIFWEKCVLNTAASGFFSSDRTILEYNDKIWHLPVLD